MAQETKRQHYVPRTYMKRFAVERNGEHYIKAIDREKIENEKSIFELNTTKICLRKNLYTLTGETEEQRQKIEMFYSNEIEDNYDRVYSILTNPIKIFITPEERELIISTIITMLYRTTKWITEHNNVWNMALERIYEICKQTGHTYFQFEGERVSIEGKSLKQIQDEYAVDSRESQVKTQLEVAFRLIRIRLNDGIFVTKLGKEDCLFITSDNPVVLRNSMRERIAPFDKNNIISLHIDEKHKLMIMPTRELSDLNVIVRHTTQGVCADMDAMVSNALQLENSEKFILGTNIGIKKYISLRKETERPLPKQENEEIKTLEDLLEKIKKIKNNE